MGDSLSHLDDLLVVAPVNKCLERIFSQLIGLVKTQRKTMSAHLQESHIRLSDC